MTTRSRNEDFYTEEEFLANYGSALDLFVEQGILELSSSSEYFRIYKAGRYFLHYHSYLSDERSKNLLSLLYREIDPGCISIFVSTKGDKTFNFQKDERIKGIQFVWTKRKNVDLAVQSLIEHCHKILEAVLEEGLIQ